MDKHGDWPKQAPKWEVDRSRRQTEDEFWDALEEFETDSPCRVCGKPMRQHGEACRSGPIEGWEPLPQWGSKPVWGTTAKTAMAWDDEPTNPNLMYHTAPQSARADILQNGLRHPEGDAIFAWDNLQNAKRWQGMSHVNEDGLPGDIWEIQDHNDWEPDDYFHGGYGAIDWHAGEGDPRFNEDAHPGAYRTYAVPPHKVRLISPGGTTAKTAAGQTFYHVAPRSARESIMANGLTPGKDPDNYPDAVYLWPQIAHAQDWQHRHPDNEIWEVQHPGQVESDPWIGDIVDYDPELDPEYADQAMMYRGTIPPNRLRLLTDERMGKVKTAEMIGDAYPGEEHPEEQLNSNFDDYTSEQFDDPQIHMEEKNWVCTGEYVKVSNDDFEDLMATMGTGDILPHAYGTVDFFYSYEAMFSVVQSNISLHLLKNLLSKWCRQNEMKFEGLLRADGSEYNDKMAKVASTLPPEPGTTPIPSNHVRLYHYTGAPEGVLNQEGIRMQNAKGESYGEPNRVWASTKVPQQGKRFAEFSMAHDDPRWDIGKFTPGINYNYPGEPSENPEQDWVNYLVSHGAHVTFHDDIRPDEIIAMHEPWQSHYRYMEENLRPDDDLSWLDVPGKAEQFPDEYRAWQEFKKRHASTRTAEAPGAGRNNPGVKDWRLDWDGETQPADYYGEQDDPWFGDDRPKGAMICPICGELSEDFGSFLVHEQKHDSGRGVPDSVQPVVDTDEPMPAHLNTNPGIGNDKTIDRAAKVAAADLPFGESDDYETFDQQKRVNARPWNLSEHPVEHYQQSRVFMSPDKQTGYMLDPSGDLQNVFNNGAKGGGVQAVSHAVENGARTLDAYDGFLPQYYNQFGFKETGRIPFNDEFAPEGWDFDQYGRPDVVFMSYQGGPRATIRQRTGQFPYSPTDKYFEDWDEAKAHSASQVFDEEHGPTTARSLRDAFAGANRVFDIDGQYLDGLGIHPLYPDEKEAAWHAVGRDVA